MKLGEIDLAAQRIKLWVGSIAVLVAIASGAGTIAAQWITRDVAAGVAENRREIYAHARSDSIRFDRLMTVVELAVVAVVEPAGSPDQKLALYELRRMRHVGR